MKHTHSINQVGKTFVMAVSICLGAVALASCGNVTSGGVGDVEVVLTSGEVIDLSATVQSALVSGIARSTEDGIQGTLTVRVRSFARRRDGEFEELTDGVQELTLSLQDPEPVEIARRALSAGRYEAVRTFFSRIEAEVTSGLVIDGVPVEGTIPVDLGALGTLSVVDLNGFDVWEGAPTVITLEMQSRVWLRLVNAVARRVDLDDFRRIFRVRIRQDLRS
jgi:hypothetical protein